MDREFKLPSTTFIGGDERQLPLRFVLLSDFSFFYAIQYK